MNVDTYSFTKKISTFFSRYHLLIFFVFIVAAISFAMFTLSSVVQSTDDAEGYTSTVNNASLDETMIERIRELRSEDEATKKLNFSGRISPF